MGRPFASELLELEDTYAWASRYDVTPLQETIRNARGPLLSVGSGGSFTAASYVAYLHEKVHGELARAATPLDSVDLATKLRRFHMLLVSSGGRNRDGLQACEALLRAEPASALILTASPGSPLAKLGHKYDANVFEFKLPGPKDGFLATNSLFAFCVLLGRAYGEPGASLPATLTELLGVGSLGEIAERIQTEAELLLDREVLLVLHGASSRAVALDVESKFSEAALGSVLVSDYRNFGHGRHHWLAKRPRQTGVVALIHETERALVTRTLAQLPTDVPCLRIHLSGDSLKTMLSGLASAYHLVAAVGRKRGIDPGRPGVPAFGSRLYSLRMSPAHVPSRLEAAAHRKNCDSMSPEALESWTAAAQQASSVISSARFASVAIDYDGTICSPRERFGAIRKEISAELIRLADAGLQFGIATGRGKSVRDALRDVLPERLWAHFRIGYYNGGFIAGLAADLPSSVLEPRSELLLLLSALRRMPHLNTIATIEPRNPQITVECKSSEHAEYVWETVQRCVAEVATPGIMMVRSSHSIDILAPAVTKLAVVAALPGPTLRIGDRGRFPGNDFALLDSPLGLSVDEVSSSTANCWNLLTAGRCGVIGTLEYLQAIQRDGKQFRIVLDGEAP